MTSHSSGGRTMRLMPVLLLLLFCMLVVLPTATSAASREVVKETVEADFYAVLGLEKEGEDATERDIKTAWRRLSKKFHPDIAGETHRTKYQEIQRAYEVLGDRRKRKVYDILGHEGLMKLEQPQQHQQFQHPLFQFFNMGGGGGGDGNRGEQLELLLMVSLEDVFSGAAHTVKFSKTRLCRSCRGSGARSAADVVKCPMCEGAGRVARRVQVMPGFVQNVEQACPRCHGKGSHVATKCSKCKGEGTTREMATISVDVEAGTPEGHVLTYELEADQRPGQVPGDVLMTIITAHHPIFERRGVDLYTSMNLTLKEALVGYSKSLRHLDGHETLLTSSGVTQHGTTMKVTGEGMPKHHVPSERGDLYVTFGVHLPQTVSSADAEKIAKLFE